MGAHAARQRLGITISTGRRFENAHKPSLPSFVCIPESSARQVKGRKDACMCTNGLNTGQLEQMINQVGDHVALEYRWAHKLAHAAGDAGFASSSEKLHAAQALLADVRALLDEAKEALDIDALAASATVSTARLV